MWKFHFLLFLLFLYDSVDGGVWLNKYFLVFSSTLLLYFIKNAILWLCDNCQVSLNDIPTSDKSCKQFWKLRFLLWTLLLVLASKELKDFHSTIPLVTSTFDSSLKNQSEIPRFLKNLQLTINGKRRDSIRKISINFRRLLSSITLNGI